MSTSASRTRAVQLGIALAVSVLACFQPSARAQVRRLQLATLLDAYAQGRHEEALTPIHQATRDSAREFRMQLVVRGGEWVDAVAADRSRRVLAAASFALEFERIRAERGEWAAEGEKDCAGRCVLEWGCTLLQSRGAADDAERAWMLATIALAGGVRDWAFLQRPIAPPSDRTPETGHVQHALARFPGDARFRFSRAVALASRNAVTDERDWPATDPGATTSPGRVLMGPAALNTMMQRNRTRLVEYVKQELEALADDVSVGSEARLRLGYLHWVEGDDAAALAAQRAAAEAASEPEIRYVAHFLAAQAAQALGDARAAEVHFRAALAARPHSQSATLGLAALLYLRGDGREAYDLVAASRTHRARDDDPWRLFLYGDFQRLPALVGELRRRVTP